LAKQDLPDPDAHHRNQEPDQAAPKRSDLPVRLEVAARDKKDGKIPEVGFQSEKHRDQAVPSRFNEPYGVDGNKQNGEQSQHYVFTPPSLQIRLYTKQVITVKDQESGVLQQ
jgi:hypothetical protein